MTESIPLEPGQPSWPAFTWRHGETMRAAMDRALLDVAPAQTPPSLPPKGGGSGRRGKPRQSKRRRISEPSPVPALRNTHYVLLGTFPDGRRYTRDPRTGEFVIEEAPK